MSEEVNLCLAFASSLGFANFILCSMGLFAYRDNMGIGIDIVSLLWSLDKMNDKGFQIQTLHKFLMECSYLPMPVLLETPSGFQHQKLGKQVIDGFLFKENTRLHFYEIMITQPGL